MVHILVFLSVSGMYHRVSYILIVLRCNMQAFKICYTLSLANNIKGYTHLCAVCASEHAIIGCLFYREVKLIGPSCIIKHISQDFSTHYFILIPLAFSDRVQYPSEKTYTTLWPIIATVYSLILYLFSFKSTSALFPFPHIFMFFCLPIPLKFLCFCSVYQYHSIRSYSARCIYT